MSAIAPNVQDTCLPMQVIIFALIEGCFSRITLMRQITRIITITCGTIWSGQWSGSSPRVFVSLSAAVSYCNVFYVSLPCVHSLTFLRLFILRQPLPVEWVAAEFTFPLVFCSFNFLPNNPRGLVRPVSLVRPQRVSF